MLEPNKDNLFGWIKTGGKREILEGTVTMLF